MKAKTTQSQVRKSSKVNEYDVIFLKHLDNVTEGFTTDPSKNWLKTSILNLSYENAKLVVNFMNDCINRENITITTRKSKIAGLLRFMKFLVGKYGHEISFKDVKREDFTDFQYSLKKPATEDHLHHWIGTYNQYLRNAKPFYRYLNDPDKEPKDRQLPEYLVGINQIHRKELTTYQPSDMWTEEEDLIFLKYCQDPRIKLYHTMARDTSGRPHELLVKRIGELKEEVDLNGVQYLETSIGAGGKTKPRKVAIYSAYPYFIDWLQHHPTPTDLQAFIFISYENGAKYKNMPLSAQALSSTYLKLKRNFFPRLIDRNDVPENDKKIIKLLLRKPWNPYVRRHTALSEKVKQVNEWNLREHAGWTPDSKMLKVYIHLNDTSSDAIKSMWGITTKNDSQVSKLKPQICKAEGCGQANKPDAAYCVKCKRILSFDGYNKVIEESKQDKKTLEIENKKLEARLERMEQSLKIISDSKATFVNAETKRKMKVMPVRQYVFPKDPKKTTKKELEMWVSEVLEGKRKPTGPLQHKIVNESVDQDTLVLSSPDY